MKYCFLLSSENVLKFSTDNTLTQIIETPPHKHGVILDLITCNHLGLHRTISYSVNPPLTDTCNQMLLHLYCNGKTI